MASLCELVKLEGSDQGIEVYRDLIVVDSELV